MADHETITISYEKHNQVLIEGLWNFLATKYRVEDVPWGGGGALKAHRLILDIFLPPEKILESITVSDDYHGHLEALLEFLYRGTVTIQRERLDGLLLLAKEMDFQMLVDAVLTSKGGQSKGERSGAVRVANKKSCDEKDDEEEPETNADNRVIQRKREKVKIKPWEPEIEIMASTASIRQPHQRPKSTAAVQRALSSLQKEPNQKFRCPECPLESSNADVIKSHRAVVHSGEKPFKCEQCDFVTCWQSTLKRHVNELHPVAGRYFCSICKQRFNTGSELDAHVATHDEVGIFKCPQCIQAFTQNKFLVDHLARVHAVRDPNFRGPVAGPNGRFTCDVCEKGFKTRHELVDHYRVHTGERPHKCPHCDKCFNRATNRATHIARVHADPTASRNFACEVCGKLFKTRPDLVAHQRAHSQERPHKCPQCDKGFKRRSEIKDHVARHHTDQGPVPATVPCETCGKLFKTRRQMMEHRGTHTQERPHKCPHCDKRFNHSSNRSSHVARVHGQGPGRLACKVCGQLFKTRHDLVEHRRSHAQEPKYKCPHCEKRFNLSSNRSSHIARVHTQGPGRFPCESCDKRFKTRPDLLAHQRSHSQERNLKCPQCDKMFKHATGVRSHIARLHTQGAAEKVQSHKCTQCEYSTAVPYQLTIHLDVVHGEGPGRFTCVTCGRRCTSRVTLERHNLTHTKEKPFKCEQCPFACSQKATLKHHVDTRHSSDSVRCKTCYKMFSTEARLEKHQLIHTQKKPFECPYCSHRTAWKKNLVKHIAAVHGGVKPTCETCGKSLNSARQLARHRLTHEREKKPKPAPDRSAHCSRVSGDAPSFIPLACDVCGERFSSIEDLAGHRLTHATESPFNFFRFQSMLDS